MDRLHAPGSCNADARDGGEGEGAAGPLDFRPSFVLPNVYFHATTAYAILRHNGVDLGKRDFIGNIHMQPN